MSRRRGSPPPPPPPLADALLRRLLPPGVVGLSMIGDLHQEYEELNLAGTLLFPRAWYWRSALALAGHYGAGRLRCALLPAGTRPARRATISSALLTDFRFSLRMLVKTPLLSAAAVLTIGLGVGLTTQTFSAVYGSILRGLPIPGQERLRIVDENKLELGIESMEMSIHDFLDLRERQTSFEDVAAFYQGTVNLAGEDGYPERFAGAYVSANALSHLGVAPALGRLFLPGEDDPDARPVMVLGYHLWKHRFGGDAQVLGRTVRVNGEFTEIVGVMPEGMRFPFNEDLWLTHRMDSAALPRGAGEDLDVFGRLREGVSPEAARAELQAIAADLALQFPETNEGVGMGLQRYELRFMPRQIRAVMWVMLLSTFGVLLIACANVANILLARATTRTKEVAIRTAMGASRLRVVRQFMVEAVVLASLGGGVGLVLSAWGLRIYGEFAAGINRPFWIDPSMDLPVLLFCLGVTALASLVAGVVPALRASGVKVGETLKDQDRGTSSLRMGRFSAALVVAEIALSAAILLGAGFMIQSVINVARIDLGFDPENVLTGRITLHEAEYPDPESRDQFFTLLQERMEAETGVVSAALGTHLPGLGSFFHPIAVEGETYPTDGDYPTVAHTAVSSDYFRTFRVEPLLGRDFTRLEAQLGGEPVVMVNQSFVERYLPGGGVLGRRIRLGSSSSRYPWMRVVGVVPDMHVGGGVGGLGDDRRSPERIYIPKGSHDHLGFALAVRTLAAPEEMAPHLREIVAELDPNLPLYDLAPHDKALKQATWAFKLFGVQFTVFGGLALFLAAVGLYAVMSFSVSQRRREMGVRMALGAERSSIIGLVLTKGAKQLSVGTALGLIVGAAMSRPLRYALYGVEAADPLVYVMILVTLWIAGLLACVFPVRAAVRADPVESMRVG
jgi:putative ABC transport system permease protein